MALVYNNVKLVNSINKIVSNISIYTILYIHKDNFIIIILKIFVTEMHLLMLFNFIWIIRHLENYITQIINNNFERKKIYYKPITKRYYTRGGRGVMVSNTTFNNISVLLVEELEKPEKTTDLPQVTDKITQCCIKYTSHEWDSNS
jgi:hypothetical protein